MLRGLATVTFSDDLAAAKQWYAEALGAKAHEPITKRGSGTAGFTTASVVDPFGNILGIMNNPHYLSVLDGRQ